MPYHVVFQYNIGDADIEDVTDAAYYGEILFDPSVMAIEMPDDNTIHVVLHVGFNQAPLIVGQDPDLSFLYLIEASTRIRVNDPDLHNQITGNNLGNDTEPEPVEPEPVEPPERPIRERLLAAFRMMCLQLRRDGKTEPWTILYLPPHSGTDTHFFLDALYAEGIRSRDDIEHAVSLVSRMLVNGPLPIELGRWGLLDHHHWDWGVSEVRLQALELPLDSWATERATGVEVRKPKTVYDRINEDES